MEQRLVGSVVLEAQALWYVTLEVVWKNCNYPLIEQQFHCQDAAEQVHMKEVQAHFNLGTVCVWGKLQECFFPHSITAFADNENTWSRA